MKITMNQLFSKPSNWIIGLLAFVCVTTTSSSWSANGEELFKTNCAACHKPLENSTGPKLQGVRQKWEDGGALEGSIYQWVHDWQVATAKDPYAMAVSKLKPDAMSKFPTLTVDDINSIFDYVDAYKAPAVAATDVATTGAEGQAEEGSGVWIWLILGAVFVVVILSIGGIKRQLSSAIAEEENKPAGESKTYGGELRAWAWKNRTYVGIGGFVVFVGIIVAIIFALLEVGVYHNYQPSQVIEFNHTIHAGVNKIDCKYCHNTVEKSRTAGIPTVNVCMNCHKGISGRDDAQKAKIAKIYDAAGFNPETGMYSGVTHPLIWNKVHNLQDFVYFNHSQHVVVGGVDCKQCHGDMAKEKTARVMPVAELSAIEGNIPLHQETLTMGWCIECHSQKEISNGPTNTIGSGYYNEIHNRLLKYDKELYQKYLADDKVTVEELGGWECAKCHY
jgi:mono/diheme cytochrome c family protein